MLRILRTDIPKFIFPTNEFQKRMFDMIGNPLYVEVDFDLSRFVEQYEGNSATSALSEVRTSISNLLIAIKNEADLVYSGNRTILLGAGLDFAPKFYEKSTGNLVSFTDPYTHFPLNLVYRSGSNSFAWYQHFAILKEQ